MRRIAVGLLALTGTLGIAGVARAGCCDDWLGCAATVCTAGVSCEIEQTIDTVKSLVSAVQTLAGSLSGQTSDVINGSKGAVTQAASDMGQVRQQSITALDQAAQNAHALAIQKKAVFMSHVAMSNVTHQASAPARQPHAQVEVTRPAGVSGIVPVLHPADPTSAADALTRADTFVHDLQTKGHTQAPPIAQAETNAVGAANRHVSIAQQISTAVAQAPLKALGDMLGDLLSHPERILDPSSEVDAELNRITQAIPNLLLQMMNEVTGEAMGIINNVQNPLTELQDAAEGGSAVTAAMKKLADSETENDLDALNHLLPPPPPPKMEIWHVVIAPAGIVGHHELVRSALARAQPLQLPVYLQHKAAVDDLTVRWQAIKAKAKSGGPLDAATTQKTDRDTSAMFAGKSPADIAKKKQELLDQASKRFANEPKTLEKVRQYIEAHAKP